MKIFGISKAIRVFESPLLCIWQFECSVHIFRGPWFIIVSLLNDLVWIFSAQISQDMHYCDYLLTNLQVIAIMSIEYLYLGSITYATFPR